MATWRSISAQPQPRHPGIGKSALFMRRMQSLARGCWRARRRTLTKPPAVAAAICLSARPSAAAACCLSLTACGGVAVALSPAAHAEPNGQERLTNDPGGFTNDLESELHAAAIKEKHNKMREAAVPAGLLISLFGGVAGLAGPLLLFNRHRRLTHTVLACSIGPAFCVAAVRSCLKQESNFDRMVWVGHHGDAKFALTIDNVNETMSKHGVVTNSKVRTKVDSEGGSKNWALVEFNTVRGAHRAVDSLNKHGGWRVKMADEDKILSAEAASFARELAREQIELAHAAYPPWLALALGCGVSAVVAKTVLFQSNLLSGLPATASAVVAASAVFGFFMLPRDGRYGVLKRLSDEDKQRARTEREALVLQAEADAEMNRLPRQLLSYIAFGFVGGMGSLLLMQRGEYISTMLTSIFAGGLTAALLVNAPRRHGSVGSAQKNFALYLV